MALTLAEMAAGPVRRPETPAAGARPAGGLSLAQMASAKPAPAAKAGSVAGYPISAGRSNDPIHYGTHAGNGVYDIGGMTAKRLGKTLDAIARDLGSKGYIAAVRRVGQRNISSDHIHFVDPKANPKEAKRLISQRKSGVPGIFGPMDLEEVVAAGTPKPTPIESALTAAVTPPKRKSVPEIWQEAVARKVAAPPEMSETGQSIGVPHAQTDPKAMVNAWLGKVGREEFKELAATLPTRTKQQAALKYWDSEAQRRARKESETKANVFSAIALGSEGLAKGMGALGEAIGEAAAKRAPLPLQTEQAQANIKNIAGAAPYFVPGVGDVAMVGQVPYLLGREPGEGAQAGEKPPMRLVEMAKTAAHRVTHPMETVKKGEVINSLMDIGLIYGLGKHAIKAGKALGAKPEMPPGPESAAIKTDAELLDAAYKAHPDLSPIEAIMAEQEKMQATMEEFRAMTPQEREAFTQPKGMTPEYLDTWLDHVKGALDEAYYQHAGEAQADVIQSVAREAEAEKWSRVSLPPAEPITGLRVQTGTVRKGPRTGEPVWGKPGALGYRLDDIVDQLVSRDATPAERDAALADIQERIRANAPHDRKSMIDTGDQIRVRDFGELSSGILTKAEMDALVKSTGGGITKAAKAELVPPEVLADYPDLAKAPAPPVEQPAAQTRSVAETTPEGGGGVGPRFLPPAEAEPTIAELQSLVRARANPKNEAIGGMLDDSIGAARDDLRSRFRLTEEEISAVEAEASEPVLTSLGSGAAPQTVDNLNIGPSPRAQTGSFRVKREPLLARDHDLRDLFLTPVGEYDAAGRPIRAGVYDRLGRVKRENGTVDNLGTQAGNLIQNTERTLTAEVLEADRQIERVSELLTPTKAGPLGVGRKAAQKQVYDQFIDLVERPFTDAERMEVKGSDTPTGEALRLHDELTEGFRNYIIESRRSLGIETPDDWGITDKGYFRHLFLGDIRLFKNGEFVGTARTYTEAQAKAIDILKAEPKANIKAEARNVFAGDPTVRVSTRRYFKLVGDIAKETTLSKDDIMEDLRGVVGRKAAKQKWAGYLLKRKGAKGYSRDYAMVMRIHARQVYRAQELSKLNRAWTPIIEDLRRNGKPLLADAMQAHLDALWGTPTQFEKQFGSLIRNSPVLRNLVPNPDLAFRQLAGRLTGMQSLLKLRLTPRSALVNAIQPFSTLWPFISTRDFVSIYAEALKPSVRRELADRGVFAGGGKVREASPVAAMKQTGSAANPLQWFGRASDLNRAVGYLYGYRSALKAGLPDAAAHQQGLSWADIVEFDNSVWNVQPALRSPAGRILGQFRSFQGKNMEVVSEVFRPSRRIKKGQRWGRAAKWTTAQLGLGGIKSMGAAAEVLGGYTIVKALQKQLQQYGMNDDQAEEIARAVYFGAPSLLGQDLSASVAILETPYGRTAWEQFGNLFGPTVGSAVEGINAGARGDYGAIARKLTPAWKTVDVARQLAEGVKGQTVKVGNNQAVRLTPFEATMRALGFQPVKVGEFYAKTEANTRERKALKKRMVAGEGATTEEMRAAGLDTEKARREFRTEALREQEPPQAAVIRGELRILENKRERAKGGDGPQLTEAEQTRYAELRERDKALAAVRRWQVAIESAEDMEQLRPMLQAIGAPTKSGDLKEAKRQATVYLRKLSYKAATAPPDKPQP